MPQFRWNSAETAPETIDPQPRIQPIITISSINNPTAVNLSSIEVCRGIAAVMVLASHSAPILGAGVNFGAMPFGTLFQFGRSGVDFFFVLSGFLIALIHWKDIGRPDRLKHYTVRRVTRIYPTYWLVLLPIIPFDIFTHTLFDNYNQPFEVLKSIFLLPQDQTIIDVTWSLRNELLFYILFGLIICSRGVGAVIIALWIAALTVRSAASLSIDNPWLNLLTYPMNFEFLAGVAAGWAFPRVKIDRPIALLTVGGFIFLSLWIAEDLQFLAHPSLRIFFLRSLAYGIAAAFVIFGLSTLELQKRLNMPQALVTLGGASYLLYLVHVPALLILGSTERHLHLLRFFPAWLLAAIYIAITIVGAVVMHLRIEKPMLRAIRNRSAKILIEPKPAPAG